MSLFYIHHQLQGCFTLFIDMFSCDVWSSMTERRFCHHLHTKTVKGLIFVTPVLTHPYSLPLNRPPNRLTNSLTNRRTKLCGALFKKVIVIYLAKILPILTHMNPVGMFPPCLLWFIFKRLQCCLKEEISM